MLWSAGVCKTIAELKCVKTVFSLYKNRGSVLTEQEYISPLVEGEDQILFTASWATTGRTCLNKKNSHSWSRY